jgi:hypothetical protein
MEHDALGLESQSLFESVFPRKRNFSFGPDDAMPGEPA